MDADPTVVFIAFVFLGVGSQVVAHFAPVVPQEEPDWVWDIIGLVATLIFTGLGTVYIVEPVRNLLAHTRVLEAWYAALEPRPIWLLLVMNLVFADFIAYWAHRALHTRPLWSTHAWHHSPKTLNWVSGMRASPWHSVFITALPLLLSTTAVPLGHAGMAPLVAAIFSVFVQHSLHSNIRVPFARQIERVWITPRYHRVHHSAFKDHTDSNFGFVFSAWDRLFGTYSDPQEFPADEPLGLDYEVFKPLSILGFPARKAEVQQVLR